MRIIKVFFVICGLVFFWGCPSFTEKNKEIIGFWTVAATSDSISQFQEMYVEINDSTLLYWERDFSYLPPYGYELTIEDTMINWLYDKPESKRFPLGKVEIISNDEFIISNNKNSFYFKKSSFDQFRQKTGHSWLNE